ncbi:MAG: hypothetical protein ACE5J3_09595 [Methanosarcinales archaeon]
MQKVGRLLPHRIGQVMKELGYNRRNGYKIWINPGQGNDVDFKVWSNNNLVLVGEVLNWSIGSRMSNKRCNNITSNLSKHNCHRVLIHTVPLNRKQWLKIRKNGIDTLKIGYQVLPKRFYDFYKFRRQTTKRKFDSKKINADIKFKISKYLKKKNI